MDPHETFFDHRAQMVKVYSLLQLSVCLQTVLRVNKSYSLLSNYGAVYDFLFICTSPPPLASKEEASCHI
jgi:hypothetical protein